MMEEFEQMSLTEASFEPYRIKNKIRLIELFGGIGAQAKALEILGADFEHYRLVEWAVNSIIGYNAIHIKDFADHSEGMTKEELIAKVRGVSADYNRPLTDDELSKKGEKWLRKVYSSMVATNDLCPDISRCKADDLGIRERERYTYICCYSFPCQDISGAGLGKGYAKGSNTRSGLLWEVERLLNELKATDSLPQILLMENVPQVCGENNLEPWNSWLTALEHLGYCSYPRIINSKDYGIPQNRRRCFMVSLLGDWSYTFPKKVKLRYRIKDFLDKDVGDEYYLSDKLIDCFIRYNKKHEERGNGFRFALKAGGDIANTITTREGNRGTDNFLGNPRGGELLASVDTYNKTITENPELAETIQPRQQVPNHGERLIVADGIPVRDATKKGYSIANDGDCVYISNLKGKRGTVQKGIAQTLRTFPIVGVCVKGKDGKK